MKGVREVDIAIVFIIFKFVRRWGLKNSLLLLI